MPPLSVDQCEACFPPTVDTTEEYELRSARTSEGVGSAGDRGTQATDCPLRLRPAGLAYDVRCGQGGVRGELEAVEGVAKIKGAPQDGRGRRSGITGIIVMRRVRFKCCAGTTVPGLHLRRNRFLCLRNTIETECMQHGCRIGTDEVSPLRHSPNPCLGRELLRTIRSEKGRCPAAFFFCSQRICTSTFFPISSRLADWQSNCHTRVSASGCNVHFAPGFA
jgi:hypothetical protein